MSVSGTPSEPRRDPEDAAIMAVIARETDTFVVRDFDGWAACWVQDARTRLVSASAAFGVTGQDGWEALASYMRGVFAAGASCEILSFERRNVSVTRTGGFAFVSFEGHGVHRGGRHERTFETRTLEQGPQGWRILHAAFVLSGAVEDAGPRIAVDGRGQVLSLPEGARTALADHPGLTISHGRLRARRPAWDAVLQEGLARAAGLHGFCQHYRFTADHGRQFRLPLVLGETAEGGLAVCMLFVRDGMTFVDLQPGGDFDARLDLARALYGLSEAQAALARHVVGGQSLTAAARELGISVNTARTHLSRIFDKTGVQSQTALVRTLLSIV